MSIFSKFIVYMCCMELRDMIPGYLDFGIRFYRSRGFLLDRLRDTNLPWFQKELQSRIQSNHVFETMELYLLGQKSTLQEVGTVLVKLLWLSTDEMKKVFDTTKDKVLVLEEEYQTILKENPVLESASFELCELRCDIYDNPVFPRSVELVLDEAKLMNKEVCLYCNIITDPNVSGMRTKGKIFFPDRSWSAQGIYPGAASVTIKFQKSNYGIVMGTQEKFDFASLQELLDRWWAMDGVAGEQYITEFEHPVLGAFYAYVDWAAGSRPGSSIVSAYIKTASGEIKFHKFDWLDDYFRGFIKREATINKLFFEQAFDVGEPVWMSWFAQFVPTMYDRSAVNHRFTGIADQFVDKFGDRRPHSYRISEPWVLDNSGVFKSPTELLQEAVNEGCFRVYTVRGLNLKTLMLDENLLFAFSSFSPNEIVQIISEASLYNQQVDETIKRYCRRGKLRVE